MDLESWTDAELISVRAELHAWCLKRKAPTWGNQILELDRLSGRIRFSYRSYGYVFRGTDAAQCGPDSARVIACFSWYKGDKQRKKNMDFLEKLEQELSRRGLKY